MTKVYSGIPPPPPHEKKLQIWDDQSLLWNTLPKMKNFRFEMAKVYFGIPLPPPPWKTSDLRWPKFTLEYPPPPNEKLQIWDGQSLLWNPPLWVFSVLTPQYHPPPGPESRRSYVETNLYPPWIPSRQVLWVLLRIFLQSQVMGDIRTLTTISNSSKIIVLNGGGDTKHCSHIAAMLRGNGELQTYSEQCWVFALKGVPNKFLPVS